MLISEQYYHTGLSEVAMSVMILDFLSIRK